MRITEINDEHLLFSNGTEITYKHYRDCCEWNYADFEQLDDEARNYEFEEDLTFQSCEESGFRFGDSRRMFFVPCYSEQNGYYSTDIDIWYNGKLVTSGWCEWRDA